MKSVGVLKVIITIVAVLVVITAFAIGGGLMHRVYAPQIVEESVSDQGSNAQADNLPPDFQDVPDELAIVLEPEPEPESEPVPEPEQTEEHVFDDPGYLLLSMRESDVFRGHLILINHDYHYVFPDENDSELIPIFDHITDSLGVVTEQIRLAASIIGPLNKMMDAFYEETGITNVVIRSGFRGLASQRQLFEENVRRWGRAGALQWAKPPGHSEHHSGLGLDFGLRVGGAVNTFTGTGAHSWFPRNSYNFGFVLRYPNNKTAITGTNFEPWHYRYVGIPHAPIMRERNWVLEEYIENIRNYTFDEPLEFTFADIVYHIFFTDELEVRLPYDIHFDISGNNIDGFIVTLWEDPTGGEVLCYSEV